MSTAFLSARILCAIGLALNQLDDALADAQFDGTLTIPVLPESDDPDEPVVVTVEFHEDQHYALVSL